MIEYRGTPLFGEGSSISHTSEFFAIAGTLLFWLLFLIFSFVIKPQPKKPEYKEVQIVLESTPVVQKTQETPAPAEAASASASEASKSAVSESAASAETPVREVVEVQPVVDTAPAKKTEQAKAKEPAKTTVKKNETQKTQTQKPAPAAKTEMAEPIQYAVDMSAGVDFNTIKTNKNVDNSIFDSMDADDFSDSLEGAKSRIVETKSSMSGTGGTTTTNTGDGIKSESKKDTKTDEKKYGSDIGKIRDTKGNGVSESGAGKNPDKSTGNNKDSIKWAEGTGARFVYNFDTELSQQAKSSMQVSKDTPFTINFSVDSDGNVMVTTIEIKNDFILSDIIKKEMKEKISKWKFGKGSGISKAQFDWILKPGN